MSSYECLICGRKLRNTKSRELGYGPVCRKKYNAGSGGSSFIETASTYKTLPGQLDLKDYLPDN